jgi:hypothetical protein
MVRIGLAALFVGGAGVAAYFTMRGSAPPTASTSAEPAVASASVSAPVVPLPTRFDDASATSVEELGRKFVARLAAGDRLALAALCPTYLEYAGLLYPEFVRAGEPLLGSLGLQWAWDNLEHASRKDLRRLVEERGGKNYEFVSIETAAPQPRGAVALYPKVAVRVKTPEGVVDIGDIFAIVGRDGRFKILRFRRADD